LNGLLMAFQPRHAIGYGFEFRVKWAHGSGVAALGEFDRRGPLTIQVVP